MNSRGASQTYTNKDIIENTNKIIEDIKKAASNDIRYDKMTKVNKVDISESTNYNDGVVARKKEPTKYVYKRISDKDKARVNSDYMQNESKYIDKNFVHFDDVSYAYTIKNGEIEILKKFKGSQKFINDVEEAWENGFDKLSNGNIKVAKSIRSAKRRSNTSDGLGGGQQKSGTSNRKTIGDGRQQREIVKTKTTKNNGNDLKNSEKGSNFMTKSK